MGNFKFGEHSTKDFDLVIQSPPTYNFPAKDVSVEHIPGRNGDLIIDNNCWQNTTRVYSVASVFKPGTDFVSNSERLIKWLTEYKGYHRLEDSYDPEVFRLAQFRNSGSLVNYYDKATVLEVSFECKPQRYLKNGEKPISFNSSVAILENPTGYPALPEINIKNVLPSDNEVLLLTVKNETEDKVTSIVSLNKIASATESYNVVLDSELQTVYSEDHDDISLFTNLNEMEFPVLYKGITKVSLDKYLENSNSIPQYNTLINSVVVNNNICLAKYKPFNSIVETKQKSVYIMSFDLLKQKLEEVYEMKSYANYCLEKALQYTFTSFNTILQNRSQSFSFQDDYSSKPDWLNISGSGDNITITAGDLLHLPGYQINYGYFITTNTGNDSDKKIIRVTSGGTIATNVKSSSTVTITFYPATSSGDLDVGYVAEGMPSWLGFDIDYDGDHSPKKIIYQHRSASGEGDYQEGYYYLPKSGLFGKAKWEKYDTTGELNSLTWSSWKKAFMPSGISTSTTVSYTYYFLPKPYSDRDMYLQYEPVRRNVYNEDGSIKKDANGNPITEISNDVYFIVEPINDELSAIRFKPKKAGYFRFNDENQNNGWIKVTQADVDNPSYQLPYSGITNSVTVSNLIYFLDEVPNYSKIDGWPEWLDPNPILTPFESQDAINAEYYDFTVLKTSWYRYTYFDELDNTLYTNWIFREAGQRLGVIPPLDPLEDPRSSGISFTAYMLEGEDSSTFPVKEYSYADPDDPTIIIKNIGFFYLDQEGKEQEYQDNLPPSWLKVSVTKGEKEDYSDWYLDFYPLTSGLYKWDQMSVWNLKEVDTEHSLVTSTGVDDTSVYFMASLPEYPTSEGIYKYCRVEVNVNGSNGNPESITVYAKQEGYYRAKNSSSWKYYKVNDEICNSKISESTDIYYLTASENNENNIEISIIPRWWSL